MADRRKRKRKSYSLKQVQRIGSHALMVCEGILLSPDSTPGQQLQACNSVSALLNSYARLYEASSLEERIRQLEANAEKETT